LEQRSQEWHAHRKLHANASEAGAVTGCNPWLPRNPEQLLLVKTGQKEIFVSKAMRHGTFYEDEALAALEKLLGMKFEPVVLTKEFEGVPFSASLDGIEKCD
jgi:putative phage-type endonuclease